MSRHCPYCNAKFIDDMARCPICGEGLDYRNGPSEKESPSAQISPKAILFGFLTNLICAVVIGLPIGLIAGFIIGPDILKLLGAVIVLGIITASLSSLIAGGVTYYYSNASNLLINLLVMTSAIFCMNLLGLLLLPSTPFNIFSFLLYLGSSPF